MTCAVIYVLFTVDMIGLLAIGLWATEPWKQSFKGHHLEP